MDGHRFDELARSLGAGQSRRGVLKGLGAAALGAIGLARAGKADAANGNLGNSVCAHWCHDNFTEDAAGHCTSDAAHGTGPCYDCGPAAPAGSTRQLCGGVCIDACTALDACHLAGVCDPASQACTNPEISCDDNNACTTDTCDPAVGCVSTPNPGAGCTTDSGAAGTCDDTGACVANQPCAGITPGTAECTADSDCGAGRACQNGGCFTLCNSSGDCPQDCVFCSCDPSIDGLPPACRDYDFGIGSCDSDAQCPPGSVCDPFIVDGTFVHHLCTRPCPTP